MLPQETSLPVFLLNPQADKNKQSEETGSKPGCLSGRSVAKTDASVEIAQLKKQVADIEKYAPIILALSQKIKDLEANQEKMHQQMFDLQKGFNEKLSLLSQIISSNFGTILASLSSLPKDMERIEDSVDGAIKKQEETGEKVALLLKLNLQKLLKGENTPEGLSLVLGDH